MHVAGQPERPLVGKPRMRSLLNCHGRGFQRSKFWAGLSWAQDNQATSSAATGRGANYPFGWSEVGLSG